MVLFFRTVIPHKWEPYSAHFVPLKVNSIRFRVRYAWCLLPSQAAIAASHSSFEGNNFNNLPCPALRNKSKCHKVCLFKAPNLRSLQNLAWDSSQLLVLMVQWDVLCSWRVYQVLGFVVCLLWMALDLWRNTMGHSFLISWLMTLCVCTVVTEYGISLANCSRL